MCNTDCRLVNCCVLTEKQESLAMAIFVLDGGQTCYLCKKKPQIAIVENPCRQYVDTT